MKVLKFGGTSVGTSQSLKNVKKIVEEIPGNAIIVVSALGGLTDKLISTARLAATGQNSWLEEWQSIKKRHEDIIENVVPESQKASVTRKINSQLEGLKRNYEGVMLLRELPEKTLDVIVSFGERMSSVIVAAMVNNGKRYFSPDFIKTEKWYGKNIAARKLTESLIRSNFENMGLEEKAIVPGFISTDADTGEITNLGRGGSDYTGALIAAALGAEILEIWTDVDGFMTADPRIVKEAIVIDKLSFNESMELCTFGAKVVYPPTIYPVFHNNIPIKILNTFNPEAPGTLITDAPSEDHLEVKGVTALKELCIISVKINSPESTSDVEKRAFNILSRQAVRIIPLLNPDPKSELKFAVSSSDAVTSLEMLRNEFAPERASAWISEPVLKENLAAIAVVGKEMRKKQRLFSRIRHTLERAGIQVEAFSSDSDTTLVILINQEKSPQAIPLIHSLIF